LLLRRLFHVNNGRRSLPFTFAAIGAAAFECPKDARESVGFGRVRVESAYGVAIRHGRVEGNEDDET
jgi:hypothetical protein